MKYKIRSLNRRLRSTHTNEHKQGLENFKSLCDKYLDKPLSEIIKIQTDLKMKEPKGRRYNQEYKEFALTLYFCGPKAYKFMEQIL